MPQSDFDRVIALSGLLQATSLVRSIARDGECDNDDFATCIASILRIDASSSENVYDGLNRLNTGLQLLIDQLRSPRNRELTRYAVALLVLERKLGKKPILLKQIGNGIAAVQRKLADFPLTHDNIIASLADIYVQTISTLAPPIMVHGGRDHLTRPENANRIRALLLAGIRAAHLWRQSGGGRLTLLLRRRYLLAEAQRVLAMLKE